MAVQVTRQVEGEVAREDEGKWESRRKAQWKRDAETHARAPCRMRGRGGVGERLKIET
jgi:hypothetical protein